MALVAPRIIIADDVNGDVFVEGGTGHRESDDNELVLWLPQNDP